MKHLKPINQKADRVQQYLESKTKPGGDVVALQQTDAQVPLGCSFVFFPGWEVDIEGGTAGLCSPVERDLFDCHLGTN